MPDVAVLLPELRRSGWLMSWQTTITGALGQLSFSNMCLGRRSQEALKEDER